jgi:hypothetical protein
MADPIAALADKLMRAVVNSGAIRSADQDADLAVRVMREELKAFIAGEKYADERALVSTNSALAFGSLTAECIRRIAVERAS